MLCTTVIRNALRLGSSQLSAHLHIPLQVKLILGWPWPAHTLSSNAMCIFLKMLVQ